MSGSYTLPECLNKPGYEDTLNAVKKGAISINWITKLEESFVDMEKKKNSLESSCNKMQIIKVGN